MKIGELIPTLTGFEELAIEEACGKSIEELTDMGTKDHPKVGRDILLGRVMGAVIIARRDSIAYPAAWQKALALPQRDLGALFTDDEDEDEVFPDEPVTDAGKDDSATGAALPSSQPSSSSPV